MAKRRSIGHVKKIGEGKYLLRLSLGFDDFGKRIQPSKVVECQNDREADKLLIEFYNEREHLKRQHNSFVPQTVGELYNEWYKHHVQKNLSETTADWYRGLWERHLSVAKNMRLDVVAPSHVRTVIDTADGNRTRHAIYKMFSAMFNKAVKWGYMETNPCVRLDAPQYSAPEKKFLQENEIRIACDNIGQEDLKYQAIFYFALLCSMRRQIIVPLKWSDIDFARNEFTIRRAAKLVSGKGTVVGEPKTKKSKQTLFLPEILKHTLLKLRNQQSRMRKLYGDKWIDEDWVFTQNDGSLMHLQTPSHWWREFSDKHGITNITDISFHGLRHTAATHMIKNNVPISTVSGVLGHANISTTLNTYTHVIEDTKKGAINIMADIVAGADNGNENSNHLCNCTHYCTN